MLTRFLTGDVTAIRQTELAFCCSFDWSETHGYVASHRWIPLSVISEDDHDTINSAADGDVIEISIAAWWLDANIG